MAYDPTAPNYGRAQRGQLSPFRDVAKRRNGAYEEEEQQQAQEQAPAPEPAPSPLAKAIAPKPSYTGASAGTNSGSFISSERANEVAQRVRAGGQQSSLPKAGSFEDVLGSGSMRDAKPGVSYSGDASGGRFSNASSARPGSLEKAMGWDPSQKQEAPADTSPLAKAVAGPAASGSGLSQPVGVGQYNLEGYDYSRFGDPNGRGNNTWKYRIGSVMSNYDPNDPGQVNAMVADLQAKGVPVSFDGKDKLTFGPEVTDENGNQIGTIDVIRGAGAAGAGWAWQPLGGAPVDPLASAVGGGAADPVAMTLAQQMGIDTSNPLWKQILDQLIAEQSGEQLPHATVRV